MLLYNSLGRVACFPFIVFLPSLALREIGFLFGGVESQVFALVLYMVVFVCVG